MKLFTALQLSAFLLFAHLIGESPRLTLLIVIDQFAYHELLAHKKFFTGGLKKLIDQGLFYQNAFHAHAMPETSVGHATLSTGTTPSQHGYIANNWITPDGVQRKADEGTPQETIIDAPRALPAGPSYLMVDTLADQIALNSAEPTNVVTLSLKSHAAIALAGRLGNPYWFDASTGFFTTSGAYAKELPLWIREFNKTAGITELTQVSWDLVYPKESDAYAHVDMNTYNYAATKEPIAGTIIQIDRSKKLPFDGYERSPESHRALLALTQKYLDTQKENGQRTIIFLSINNLDKVGHLYGPNSYEIIDTLYHLDRDLGTFFDSLNTFAKPEETLIALTADHGVFPILETLPARGIFFAKRASAPQIINAMNELVAQEFGIENLVIGYISPQFYLNQNKIADLDSATHQAILAELIEFLKTQPVIRDAWSYEEILKTPCPVDDIRQLYKNQLYFGRSGDIIVQVRPYTYIDHFTSGTAHGAPYDYDTHVPLIFYQQNVLPARKIDRMVYTTQVAPTIALRLGVPRPSASRTEVLHEVVSLQ
jgi:predicted AlkP superfamily pyrophosphatase or phosphodiesterase